MLFKQLKETEMNQINGGVANLEDAIDYIQAGMVSVVTNGVALAVGASTTVAGGAAVLMGAAIMAAQDSGCTTEGQKKYLPYEWAD